MPFDRFEAERCSQLEQAARLRVLAAETADVSQKDFFLLLANSYENLAGPAPRKPGPKA